MNRRCLVVVLAAVILTVNRFGGPVVGVASDPCNPRVNVAASAIPEDVTQACHQLERVDAFDHHSWGEFLALTRAAKPDARGVIDPTRPIGSSDRPLVFETYKALWEVFDTHGNQPSNWNAVAPMSKSPCSTLDGPAQPAGTSSPDLVLSSFGQQEDIQQFLSVYDTDPALVAQNGTVVRYLTAFNQVAFEAIVREQLYLASKLGRDRTTPGPPAIQLPEQSIVVKSAWMILTAREAAKRSRYHVRRAWVRNLTSPGHCAAMDVALIGLHIMHKTHGSPQWIWSSFEHVDNLNTTDSPAPVSPFALHDGGAAAMPTAAAAKTATGPFNVTRKNRIDPSTNHTNAAYVAALHASSPGVVWQNYRLVMTQWPRSFNQPNQRNDSVPGVFNALAARSSFNNPVFETLFQDLEKPPGHAYGCLNCHDAARDRSDYLWTPVVHAFPMPDPGSPENDPTLKALRDDIREIRGITH